MLSGYLVLDCTDALGWMSGRILAELGADVLKIEAPGSDTGGADWQAANINKRTLTLNLDTDAGRAEFVKLLAKADFLLETATPGSAAAAIDEDCRKSANAGLIHVAITPFGRTGPCAGWLAGDLEIMAGGGAMTLAGEPDGMPVRISVPQSRGWAGAMAAVGALMALNHRAETGEGQLVDVSAQASVVAALAHAPAFWDIERTLPKRAGAFMTGRSIHGASYRVFWPCKDGYLNFILYGGVAGRRTNEGLVSWMREAGADLGVLADIDWATFDPTQATQEEVDTFEAPISKFFLTVTKREFLNGAFAREMLGYPVSTVEDISTDPQLEARGFWQDLPGPDGKVQRHCGGFAIVDGERLKVRRPSQIEKGGA
ncbi:MAG: CoA transferase [Rhodospirillales bacterium]|nr:CoA transferase [Rhodospirillales bacterium]